MEIIPNSSDRAKWAFLESLKAVIGGAVGGMAYSMSMADSLPDWVKPVLILGLVLLIAFTLWIVGQGVYESLHKED